MPHHYLEPTVIWANCPAAGPTWAILHFQPLLLSYFHGRETGQVRRGIDDTPIKIHGKNFSNYIFIFATIRPSSLVVSIIEQQSQNLPNISI